MLKGDVIMQNNNTQPGNEICGISCQVTDCQYNDNKKCMAGHINVGPSSATTTSETDCETFKAR